MQDKEINRIVLLTVESLFSSIALAGILPFDKRIGLIVISDRFNDKHGSVFDQFIKNVNKSGLLFTIYLSLIFLFYPIILSIYRLTNKKDSENLLPIQALAKKLNIKTFVTSNVNSNECIEAITQYDPDVLVSSYFDQLIGKEVFQIPKVASFNMHSGLLPSYKGPFPIFWELLNSEKTIGIYTHYINEVFDSGELLNSEIFECPLDTSLLETEKYVYSKFSNVYFKTFDIILGIESKKNDTISNKVGYHSFPNKNEVKNLRKIRPLFRLKDLIYL